MYLEIQYEQNGSFTQLERIETQVKLTSRVALACTLRKALSVLGRHATLGVLANDDFANIVLSRSRQNSPTAPIKSLVLSRSQTSVILTHVTRHRSKTKFTHIDPISWSAQINNVIRNLIWENN